ncbi:cytosine permease [Acinetobacter qingfengensis]|uniref:Nitrate reductase n=1 Tax=Acinetobacter qingfengensis TaxID=1262585 RepID=A0A1E7R514_9GAMM|nr:cytosine permease [Acinetobacter qingfengensis]KAA8732420.1 cytosine permease [Acinetobacter qingfengensis]OEY94414.1 nitrate reductase [Acinetobacter qingfengensis]
MKISEISSIERNGIDIIPEQDRTSSPKDLFRLIFGGANTFATVVLGSFPILFGLSLSAGMCAILLGVFIGSIILAPMGLFGPINGTNNAVSSGAHFGIHGRIVGSFLSLLTAITFFALSVWSSGDALIGGLRRTIGLENSHVNLSIAYACFAFVVLLISIYGYKWLLLVSKFAVFTATAMFVLGFFAFFPEIDFAYQGHTTLGQPGFWAVFIGATLIAMSNPISFGAFLGDWARYIPTKTSKISIMMAVIFAQMATLLPFFFGLFTAAIIAIKAPFYLEENNYIGGLLALAPDWYYIPLCIIAIIGGLSTGTTALYGTGLDISSIFPKLLNRIQATILTGILSVLLIFIGRFVFNLTLAVSTFACLIIVCTTPWIMIMVIGFIQRKGYYNAQDLQVFNRGEHGGVYWFHHGWNWRGMIAWIPSAIIGVMFVNIPGQFVGVLGNIFSGIDMSLIITIALSTAIYLFLLKLFPEPAEVYAPAFPTIMTENNPDDTWTTSSLDGRK